jgi:FtsP/CotA-like multicopper oxidase with cupredoxin domain
LTPGGDPRLLLKGVALDASWLVMAALGAVLLVIEFDFVADNPGSTLFHCHQRLHMDFGFMARFENA